MMSDFRPCPSYLVSSLKNVVISRITARSNPLRISSRNFLYHMASHSKGHSTILHRFITEVFLNFWKVFSLNMFQFAWLVQFLLDILVVIFRNCSLDLSFCLAHIVNVRYFKFLTYLLNFHTQSWPPLGPSLLIHLPTQWPCVVALDPCKEQQLWRRFFFFFFL